MKTNVGSIDRLLRGVIGLALIVLPLIGLPDIWQSAGARYLSVGIGAILVLTALVRFCPLYGIFGVSSCKR